MRALSILRAVSAACPGTLEDATAAAAGAKSVALTALATGYGHLSLPAFGRAVRPLVERGVEGIADVFVVVPGAADAEAVRESAGG